MKKIIQNHISYLVICISFFNCSLFSQNVSWAKQITPYSSWNAGNHVSFDNVQNSYITGLFNGSNQYGNQAGSFIQKMDTSGNTLWNKIFTGVFIYGSCSDSIGNLYITGRFGGTVNFGSDILSGNGWNFFVAKYDANGNGLWVKTTGQATGNTLKTDGYGNVYITGAFGGTCFFGSHTVTQTMAGYTDFFIVKYNSAGTCLWAKQTSGGTYGTGDLFINKNNIYVIDNYVTPITFGNGNNSTTLTTHGGSILLAKYTTSGIFLWAKQVSDSGQCAGKGIVVDDLENIYLSGWYSKKVKFGNILMNCGYSNAFLSKYNINGILKWANQPLNENGYGYALSINSNQEIYLSTALEKAGAYTSIIKYDTTGNEKWRTGYSSSSAYSSVVGYGISFYHNKIYLTGEFFGNVNFGSHILNKNFNGPDSDAFVLKIYEKTNETAGVEKLIDTKNEITITVFPNPTNGHFKIACSGFENCSLQLNITNVAGQRIYSETYEQSKSSIIKDIDLGKQAKGTYFIELVADKKRAVRKIVVD